MINGRPIWAVPFPGSDKSVVQRTQYFNYTQLSKKPVRQWKIRYEVKENSTYFRCVFNLISKWLRLFPSLNLLLLVWYFHYLPNLNLVFNAYFKYFFRVVYITLGDLFVDLVSRFVFSWISHKRRTHTSGCKLRKATNFRYGLFLVRTSDIQNDFRHSHRNQGEDRSRIYRSRSRIHWNIENVNCLCDDAIEGEWSLTGEVGKLMNNSVYLMLSWFFFLEGVFLRQQLHLDVQV